MGDYRMVFEPHYEEVDRMKVVPLQDKRSVFEEVDQVMSRDKECVIQDIHNREY